MGREQTESETGRLGRETGVKPGTLCREPLPVVPSSRGGGGGGGGGGRGGYLRQWHASWHCSLTFSATVREHDLWSSPLWCGREKEEGERERERERGIEMTEASVLQCITQKYHQHNTVRHKWRCSNTQQPLSSQHCGYPLSILFIPQAPALLSLLGLLCM